MFRFFGGGELMKNYDFLLKSSEPWTVYRTMVELAGYDEKGSAALHAKAEMLGHPLVKELVSEFELWPGKVLNSHKSAGQLYHKLIFASDIGITKEDLPHPEAIIKNMLSSQSEEGLFRLPMNIPEHFGGTGEDTWGWALCDAPSLMYSAKKLHLVEPEKIRKGVEYLISLARDNGWPCAVCKELGKFRGPGRKEDPCPYANLIMIKLLALFDEYRNSREAHIGVECLLSLWENSKELHPYMFFMGTDFRKLKAPFIWYDILHVADILSQYEWVRKDSRFLEMIELIHSKADIEGFYTPESEWKAWKGWDFGQKKAPSSWLTFLVNRIDKRVDG
jgi:hypothetical protein